MKFKVLVSPVPWSLPEGTIMTFPKTCEYLEVNAENFYNNCLELDEVKALGFTFQVIKESSDMEGAQ